MKQILIRVLLAVATVTSTVAGFADPPAVPATLGEKISDFTLTDYRGKKTSLSDYADKKIVVVAFLGTDCPLAKLYGPRVQELSQEYADRGVAVIGINANRQDTLTHIASYARRHGITFPILKDGANKVADQFQAQRTPEVFLLDKDRTVRYWGRIDDEFGIGYTKEFDIRRPLKTALDELLAGKKVTQAAVPSVGCLIGRIHKINPDSKVTYSKQIARIFKSHCVECHREGEIAPFSLTNYDEVAGWAEMIREVVNQKRMPPWHADPAHGKFKNDRSLTEEQIADIDIWVRNGAPEGDPKDLPEPPTFTPGWQLSRKPDALIAMADKPFHVKAEGEIRYQYLQVDPQFKEDKYVSAAEIIPGNRAVVHHVLVFVKPPGESKFLGAGGGEFLTGYVPGKRVDVLPPGMAKVIPAGSKLVFQMHYTPIGTEQTDLTKLGLLFTDPEKVHHVVVTDKAINPQFTRKKFPIPAGDSNFEISGRSPAVPLDVQLLAMMPHMHLRGKSFSYEAVFPDGRREELLDVPAYDFNWQTSYRLAQPIDFPAGTYINCAAHYNNSERNPANPDPKRDVLWGDQTSDEMMIGYFDIAVPVDSLGDDLPRSLGRRKPGERLRKGIAAALFKQLDADGNGALTIGELKNPKHVAAFPQFDTDKDDKVTLEELETGLKKAKRPRR